MANYCATARTNYFNVRDIDAFHLAMASVPDIHIDSRTTGGTQSCALFCQGDAGWPSEQYTDDPLEDAEAIDLPGLVAEHLADGSVAVFLESGNEGLRFIDGRATAVDACGGRIDLGLHGIFALAAQQLRGEAQNEWG